jgi:Brp/Blh family beta-carotene 15,15'-monooxygenase
MTSDLTTEILPRFRIRNVKTSELKLLNNLRAVSRYCILFAILVSLAFVPLGGVPLQGQIVLALVALTIGIPHGAVDHLISVPKKSPLKMSLFVIAYLAVVGVAIWAILSANLLGFQLVVFMSAVHFGLGDAAFVAEIDKIKATSRSFPRVAFIVASGFTPVIIPLVSSQSAQALAAVNPRLVNWTSGLAPALFTTMLVLVAATIGWMLFIKRFQEAIDLALLLLLVLVAPPLVAFALYFGLWHALRHTGRISLELPKSRELIDRGDSKRAFVRAFTAGAPALAMVLVFTIVLGFARGFNLSQDLLWYLLVVIWALTVPHMALTLRLDAKALKAS